MKKDKQNKEKLNFTDAPMRYILMLAAIVIVAFGVIYYIFSQTSIIPAGLRLTRADWLSFIGDYLSFAGTAVVSIIALWQTYHYNERADKQRAEDRWKSIQPVFSVEISKRNSPIPNAKIFSTAKHNNVAIQIKNVVDNPIKHVSIFDEYRRALFTKEDSPITCYCAYENSPDAKLGGDVIVLTEKSYPKDANGLPELIQICYEDIDGNYLAQSFKTEKFDGNICYSYCGIIKLPKEKFSVEF